MLPFQHVKDLGVGSSAVVDVVQHEITGTKFAHKAFNARNSRNLEGLKRAFKNEIDIIKRLHSHPHLIQIYWSYTCGETLGMLLTPVASDGDLKAYLQMVQTMDKPLTPEQYSILGRSFGCLASGLAFVHSHKVRHKDIKPANILIHEGQMIISDFGIALDASGEDAATTTTGPPGAFTDRYRAPEVAMHEPRNRKSDVFSLGCVFLEIMASLAPGTDIEILDKRPYWTRVNDVQDNLIRISNSDSSLHQMCLIFSSMLQSRSTDHVKAEAVLHRMRTMRRSRSKPPYELICKDCEISVCSISGDITDGAKATDPKLGLPEQEEYEQLQDAPTFSLHINHHEHLTTQAAVERAASKPSSQGERREVYIYIF